jgi:hypothetical protein
MGYKRELLLNLFNVQSLVNAHLVEDLDRLEQLDKLAHWYEECAGLPQLHELAEHQLKQRVEAAALEHFSSDDFEAFRLQWRELSTHEQRSFLCKLVGLPAPLRTQDCAA